MLFTCLGKYNLPIPCIKVDFFWHTSHSAMSTVTIYNRVGPLSTVTIYNRMRPLSMVTMYNRMGPLSSSQSISTFVNPHNVKQNEAFGQRPVMPLWLPPLQTPQGSVHSSSSYSGGQFHFLLPAPPQTGRYTCRLPDRWAGTACLPNSPTASPRASVVLDGLAGRLTLLEAEQERPAARQPAAEVGEGGAGATPASAGERGPCWRQRVGECGPRQRLPAPHAAAPRPDRQRAQPHAAPGPAGYGCEEPDGGGRQGAGRPAAARCAADRAERRDGDSARCLPTAAGQRGVCGQRGAPVGRDPPARQRRARCATLPPAGPAEPSESRSDFHTLVFGHVILATCVF